MREMAGAQTQLPPHLELQRTRVICNSDAPTHTESVQYSGAYASIGYDNSLCLDEFRQNFRVEVQRLTEDEIEFDMIGIDAALANAFRRILIAEVPTMAIEKVLILDNTSVIQDEVLAHRLGMIPVRADPRLFTDKAAEDVANEKNTIVFKLSVKCSRQGDRLQYGSVKSEELKWQPGGSTYEMVSDDPQTNTETKTYTTFSNRQDSVPAFAKDPICSHYPDILVAKLRPGQSIELEAHAIKGIGKSHAKWSPVATATYRMLPEVVIVDEVNDELAEELVEKCPKNVFDIEDVMGEKRAKVSRPRDCTLCRECVRGDGWEKRIQLRRVKEHFIFKIESTGALRPEVLFTEAVKILMSKCQRILTEIP